MILNDIIDTDNEIARLQQGMEITRQRKKKDVMNDKRRALAKEKLISGNYSPLQYLQNVSHSLSDTNHVEKPTLSYITDDSEYSDETEIEVRNPVCVDVYK